MVPIADADSFFRDLTDKVLSLDEMAQPHPLTAPVAAATVKRYIPDPLNQIRLHELVMEETERLYQVVAESVVPTAANEVGQLMEQFAAHSNVLVTLIANGCYHGTPKQTKLWRGSLERIGDMPHTALTSRNWMQVRHVPAALLMYAGGIAATVSGNVEPIAALLQTECVDYAGHRAAAATLLTTYYIDSSEKYVPQTGSYDYPLRLSNWLHQQLREPLSHLIPGDKEYDSSFDRFEYMLALVQADFHRDEQDSKLFVGRFALDQVYRASGTLPPAVRATDAATARLGGQQPYLRAGLFGCSYNRQVAAVKRVHKAMEGPWYIRGHA